MAAASAIWKPLNAERKEIRLLFLEPAISLDETIRGTLKIASLLHSPVYEAVSYCWGDANDTTEILLHDWQTAITINLASALRRLRHSTEQRVLWVDAVCIDQSDPAERGRQVGTMGDIFSEAVKVNVWLGEADPVFAPGHAFDHMKNVAQGKERGFHTEEVNDDQLLRCLYGIFGRPWFGRLWVVQETVLAKTHEYVCGPYRCPGDVVLGFMQVVNDSPCALGNDNATATDPRTMQFIYLRKIMSDVLSIRSAASMALERRSAYALMQVSRQFGCTEPRDRVYATLSLTNLFSQAKIDYSKPTEVVYMDAAVAFLHQLDSLELLLWACLEGLPEKGLSVPSWVPDWNTRTSLVSTRPDFWPVHAWAAFDASAGVPVNVRVETHSKALIIPTRIVDAIRLAGPKWQPSRGLFIQGMQRRLAFLDEWRSFLQASPETFWHTITRGVWRTGELVRYRRLSPADCAYMEDAFHERRPFFESGERG
ncbi:hypothetical protein LTR85_000335 [Meristemomyces frigidus]|nr:hypothetical protein LTR85_000335 [Meristemomyces frigidus]